MDMSNDSVGWKAGGTISRSSGFDASFAESALNRGYRLESELGYYKDVCYIVMNGYSYYNYTKWSYIPIRLTGGYSTEGVTVFSAPYCTGALAAGTWSRYDSAGSAWNWSIGFKISNLVGFDVSSTSNWDGNNRLYYKQPVSGKYKLCGNNTYPSSASRIIGAFA
ncbi:hypothetical protein BIU82_13910 [Arthrobacter sp. SW1]|nr:hypothetical protein BIU82_13910 [Arthrobacter sp. SW1]